MSGWVEWAPIALLTLAAVALVVVVLRDRTRRREELAAAYAVIAGLEERVDDLARRCGGLVTGASAPSSTTGGASAPSSTTGGAGVPSSTTGGAGVPSSTASGEAVLITRIAEPEPSAEADRRIDGSLFADLVLRESLVKGVSLAYGIGRALSPETRNRIRFLMRQEVKRSRKQRRADLRAARRHLADLQREDAA